MTSTQHEIFDRRTNELEDIAESIHALDISNEWINAFTHICLYRGWVQLKPHHLEEMEKIASVNCKHVLFLANYGKQVGLKLLYELSTDADGEEQRKKAVELILEQGVKYSKSAVDLILSMKTPSLFEGIHNE